LTAKRDSLEIKDDSGKDLDVVPAERWSYFIIRSTRSPCYALKPK
jgi:hypothetical protein